MTTENNTSDKTAPLNFAAIPSPAKFDLSGLGSSVDLNAAHFGELGVITGPVDLSDAIGLRNKSRLTGADVLKRALSRYDDDKLEFLSSEMADRFMGQTVCIVGSGPSINRTLPELLELVAAGAKICAVNAAHDWLVDKGLIPHFGIVADPKPWVVEYQTIQPKTIYFVASSCHDDVIAKYREHRLTLVWHACGAETEDGTLEQAVAIGAKARETGKGAYLNTGGSTTTMRAMDLCTFLGFRHQHFFGVDSSGERLASGTTMHGHAKPHVVKEQPRPVHVKDPTTGKVLKHEFWSNGPMEHQAIHWELVLRNRFDKMRAEEYPIVEIVVHGDGLWPASAAMYGLHFDPTYAERLRAEGYIDIPDRPQMLTSINLGGPSAHD